ncbi:MAG: B12-binding domain-containing radical SAM protein [Geobacter sp.]|nr:B12-binding domain-containing radical SAM protein [Geobacter sp.]
MNVLLVNPPSSNVFTTFGMSLPPMGLLYVAASLEAAGHRVVVRDLQIDPDGLSANDLRNADAIGISADTTRVKKAMAFARRAAASNRPVIMGGPHPQFMSEEVLGSGSVDYIVKGEGEQVFVDLLAALSRKDDPAGVNGIVYRDGHRILETPNAPPPDVEKLPFPARHLVDMHRYSATLDDRPLTPVITSRGCPSACRFCSSSSFFGRGWRSRTAASVLAELEEVYERYGFRAVAFTDDNFTLAPQRVVEIADGIREQGYDLKWWNFSRVDTIVRNPEMVRAMAASGSTMVYLGIESNNEETLRSLGKGAKTGEADQAVKLLQGSGIGVYGSYIIGNLNEAGADVKETIDMAIRLDTDVAQFSILTPYPGTELYEEIKGRIFTRKWKFYDGLHLVFRHPRINRHLMQYLLINAFTRFYRRSRKAKEGFKSAGRRSNMTVGKVAACVCDLLF